MTTAAPIKEKELLRFSTAGSVENGRLLQDPDSGVQLAIMQAGAVATDWTPKSSNLFRRQDREYT